MQFSSYAKKQYNFGPFFFEGRCLSLDVRKEKGAHQVKEQFQAYDYPRTTLLGAVSVIIEAFLGS